MTALSELLQRANREQWSTREIARRAEKNGHVLSQATVSKYLGARHGTPSEAVLAAFSDVLWVPLEQLREAAGVPAGENRPWSPPAEANRLDQRQRRALDELIRSMVTSETDREDRTDDAPAADEMADQPVQDGVSNPAHKAAAQQRARRERERRQRMIDAARHGDTPTNPLPEELTADSLGLAAKNGRNRGAEQRRLQDEDAEAGGA